MTSAAPLRITALCILLMACGAAEEPTRLAVPEGAIDVRQVDFLHGQAHQTDFMLKVRFPANPAFEHYLKMISKPWIRCDWSGPEWQSFLDATSGHVHTVHQQLHMWINRDARRSLMLSMRYQSPTDCAPQPVNDDQRVAVVEYFGVDLDEMIGRLNLRCPAVQVRSNSTPHTDARGASCKGESPAARTGGRER
jgi:hypothetical protein